LFFLNSSKLFLFLFHFTPSVPNMEGHNLNNFYYWKSVGVVRLATNGTLQWAVTGAALSQALSLIHRYGIQKTVLFCSGSFYIFIFTLAEVAALPIKTNFLVTV
jgi:hypothetical protein